MHFLQSFGCLAAYLIFSIYVPQFLWHKLYYNGH